MIKVKRRSITNCKNISKDIKIFKTGMHKSCKSSRHNNGHNSSTIEALVNGKYIMVPF